MDNQHFVVLRHHFLKSNILDLYADGPVKLNGVHKSEFEALYKLLYSLYVHSCDTSKHSISSLSLTTDRYRTRNTLSKDEWEAVLKMSAKLKMLALRIEAVGQLSALSITPLKQILLGRKYGIVEWLRSGYFDLATKAGALSMDEFNGLGLETALLLSQKVRRAYRHRNPSGSVAPLNTVDKYFRKLMDDAALNGLTQTLNSDEVDRILLAQSLGIPEWLYTAYGDLAKRQEDITFAEAGRLGIETTHGLCYVREYLRLENSDSLAMSWNAWSVQSSIDTIFRKELAEVRQAGVVYVRKGPPGVRRSLGRQHSMIRRKGN